MVLRKANGQFYMELTGNEALRLITQLSQGLDVACAHNFSQTMPFATSYVEGYQKDAQHYPNVINIRVEPL